MTPLKVLGTLPDDSLQLNSTNTDLNRGYAEI